MYFVYVLWSEKIRKRYVGSTKDIGKRLAEHNSRHTRFTKGGIPWIIIHKEEYSTLSEARKREYFLKTGVDRKIPDQITNHS